MKAMQFKHIAMAGVLALGLANQSFAVDVAESTSVMADLECLVVQAKAALANASLTGVDATAEAGARAAAIDEAVKAGREALAAMTQAIADGDETAAQAAEDALAAALSQARDALAGVLPEKMAAKGEAEAEPEEAGEELPNIYDVPWKSEGIRAYYQSLFGSFHDASSFGGEKVINVDEDATKM